MKKYIKILITIISCLLIGYGVISVIKWYSDNKKSNQIKESTNHNIEVPIMNDNEKRNDIQVDFNNLKRINNNTVGYIKVNNTDINYVIVKGNDNSYYLNHDFNNQKNVNGWIFADYRNRFDGTDKNIIIYGHNMINGSMFGTLKNVLNEEWYMNEDNLYIRLSTVKENMLFKVFSIYQIVPEDYYIETNFTEKEFHSFLEVIKNRSIYNFNNPVNTDSVILTLSTCSNDGKRRTVLHAVKIS